MMSSNQKGKSVLKRLLGSSYLGKHRNLENKVWQTDSSTQVLLGTLLQTPVTHCCHHVWVPVTDHDFSALPAVSFEESVFFVLYSVSKARRKEREMTASRSPKVLPRLDWYLITDQLRWQSCPTNFLHFITSELQIFSKMSTIKSFIYKKMITYFFLPTSIFFFFLPSWIFPFPELWTMHFCV